MLKIKPGKTISLPAWGTWPKAHHIFDARSIWAVNAALAAERPLLIRGEPGTGKSQLARAAAVAMGRMFVSEVVHARSECHDLQFWFDAVGRLGEAQLLGAAGKGEQAAERLAPQRFLAPGPLWWVFGWNSALAQFDTSGGRGRKPHEPEGWSPAKGSVLLIDEIDKAEADLPNGLLETLGNSAFAVPHRRDPVRLEKLGPPPLVVISTNEERELPAAFVRRCLVLHLELPAEEKELVAWLMTRGKVHFDYRQCPEAVQREAAMQLAGDRRDAKRLGHPAPGQAEYLDLLRAVSRLAKTKEAQLNALAKISDFALKKHPEE